MGLTLHASGPDNQIDATVRLGREAAATGLRSAWFGQTARVLRAVPLLHPVLELAGAARAGDVAVIGDEKAVAAEVRRYRDAGATEVVFSGTDPAGEADRRRTRALLGELAG